MSKCNHVMETLYDHDMEGEVIGERIECVCCGLTEQSLDMIELKKENAELKDRWNKLKNNFKGETAGMYGNYHNMAKIMEDMEVSNDE